MPSTRNMLVTGVAGFLGSNLLKKLLEENHNVIGIDNLSVEEEMQFHTKIYEIAGNDFILQLDTIMHPIFVFAKQHYKHFFLPVQQELKKKGGQVTHPDLLFFLKSRDEEGYRNAIKKHLKAYWEFIYHFDNN